MWSWRPDGWKYTAELPTSADSKNKCVANGSPVTHQTLQQQGGTGEDSHIHLADWNLSVTAIKKKINGQITTEQFTISQVATKQTETPDNSPLNSSDHHQTNTRYFTCRNKWKKKKVRDWCCFSADLSFSLPQCHLKITKCEIYGLG